MANRKDGWYWVKFCGRWVVAEWEGEFYEHWQCSGMEGGVPESCFEEIGTRVPSPDEPWKCVPIEPTKEMLAGTRWARALVYGQMLEAAPNPEDV